jgi:Tol biopolymer transport system component
MVLTIHFHGMNLRFLLIQFFLILSIIINGCKKEPQIEIEDNNPLKVTTLLPLTDNIPFQELGSGKILFERSYGRGESVFYIIDIDKRITSGFKMKSPVTQPMISPAGTKIACSLLNSADVNSAWNIYIMNIDGSGCFAANKSDRVANYPTWNGDGSKIIYYTSGPDGRLYMQSPVENSSDRVELIKFQYEDDPEWGINPSGGFSISPAGKLVSVSSSENLDGLIGIEPYIGKAGVRLLISRLTDLYIQTMNCRVESAVFSHDGLKIAFLTIYTNPQETGWINLGINTVDPDGTNLIQLSGMGGYQPPFSLRKYVSMCWSPDGKKILFTIPDGEKTCHLYVVNVDGSGFLQVTNEIDVFDSEVSWSR